MKTEEKEEKLKVATALEERLLYDKEFCDRINVEKASTWIASVKKEND